MKAFVETRAPKWKNKWLFPYADNPYHRCPRITGLLGRRNIMCDAKISDGVVGDEPVRGCGRRHAVKNKIPHYHQPENLALRIKRGGAREARHRYRLTQFDCVTVV